MPEWVLPVLATLFALGGLISGFVAGLRERRERKRLALPHPFDFGTTYEISRVMSARVETLEAEVEEWRRRMAALAESRADPWPRVPVQGQEHPRWPGPAVPCDECGELIQPGSLYTANALHEVVHPWECRPGEHWEQPPAGASGVRDDDEPREERTDE